MSGRPQGWDPEEPWEGGSPILSIKLNGDGRELLGGTMSASLLVYDLVAGRLATNLIQAHDEDINSVCFANR